MNKQELIDKVVEQFKGNAKEISSNYEREGYKIIYHANNIYGICYVESHYADGVKYVSCSIDEFNQRARELGWINGYKWGVEYPTNGKKPDLPDELNVIVKYENGWRQDNDGTDIVEEWVWGPSVAFKIVDKRYKPVEVEQVQADKPKRDLSDASFALTDAVDVLIGCGELELAKKLKDMNKEIISKQENRKADEEKRVFVDKTKAFLPHVEDNLIQQLWYAGCRFK